MIEEAKQAESSCQSSVNLDPSQLQKLKNHYEEFVMKWPQGYDYCEVCLIKEGLKEDELIICDLCDGLVHQSCYGGELLSNIPENSWFCGRCRILVDDYIKKDGLLHPKGDKSLQCALCPEQKGVMKSIFWKNQNHTQLAHMGCVVSLKCLVFEDNLRSIVTKQYEPKRNSNECSICEMKMGICGVCHKSGCQFSFHFSCGKRAGIIQDVTLMNTLIECREKKYNRSEPEHHIAFCEEHLYELSYIEYPDDKFLKYYPICKGIKYTKRQLEEQYSQLARKKQKNHWDQKKQQTSEISTANKEQQYQESQASQKLDKEESASNQKGITINSEKLKKEDTKIIITQQMDNQIERRSRRSIKTNTKDQEKVQSEDNIMKDKSMVKNKRDNLSKKVELTGRKQVEQLKKEDNISQQTKKDKKQQEEKGNNNINGKKQITNVSKENSTNQEGKNTNKDTKVEMEQEWQRVQKVLLSIIKNEGKGKGQQDEINSEIDSMEDENMHNLDDCSILDIDEMIRNGLDHRQPDLNIPCDNDSQSNLDSSEDSQHNLTIELDKLNKTTNLSMNSSESQKELAPQKDMFQLHSDLRESFKLTGPFPQRRWKKEIAHFFVRKNCLNPVSKEILIDKCTDKKVREVFSAYGLPFKIKTLHFFKLFKAHFLNKVKNSNPQTATAAP